MKIHLRMLGCRLNQAEIDAMARQFQQQGHEIVTGPEVADQIIVNTCAVTNEATRTSRKLIRDLHRTNPTAQTTVTGCYAQIAPDDIAILPGVTRVVNNLGKDTLVEQITGVPVETFDHEPFARDDALPGASLRTRSFVKVQDGCDNACTFCVTTIARGEGRSRSTAEIIHEIRGLHESGFQEVVLTGVHLGSYGHDLTDGSSLSGLVRAILADTDIPRVRLSSLEPWDLASDFFELWENDRLCRHLHLPLQSGCDATLHRMRRNTSQVQFRALVESARAQIPQLSVTTDVIVGFPGETDEEFAISKAFIESMEFAGLHVFRYSKRPGTPAARMKHHVSKAVKKERSATLLALDAGLQQRFAEQLVGQTGSILWEQVTGATQDGFINVGYTDNYVRVRGTHPRVLTNMITPADLHGYDNDRAQIVAAPIIV
ncbi:MAG: tRNA (N(6)-L-threonylcarbamoyladenosine(37)-C(2))-methylthiotransferase MtaB [Chloroflexota bacterium]